MPVMQLIMDSTSFCKGRTRKCLDSSVALNHGEIPLSSSPFSTEVLIAPIAGVFTANGSRLSSFPRNCLLLKAIALPTVTSPLQR